MVTEGLADEGIVFAKRDWIARFAAARIFQNSFSGGSRMGDLALVVFFISMLIVPCCLGVRSIRADGFTSNTSDGVNAVGDPSEMGEGSFRAHEATVDRRSLALQRSREIYFRSGGSRQRPDGGPRPEHVLIADSASRPRRVG